MTRSYCSYDLVILTDQRWVSSVGDDYHANVLKEDQLLITAFEASGLRVTRQAWNANFDWSSTRFALFRSTWDYFDRLNEFMEWFETTRTKTEFINPTLLIQWNLHKSYLLDLAKKGIDIVPTQLFKQHQTKDLFQFLESLPWEQFVVKPAISAGAYQTFLMNASSLKSSVWFEDYLNVRDLLIQPFLPDIRTKGEVSLVYFGDQFSHAVLKKARKGDYRVQDDHGGTVHDYTPSSSEIEFGLKALKACPTKPLYSRVDFSWDSNGKPLLMEIELIEPELWFRRHPDAAKTLADQFRRNYI